MSPEEHRKREYLLDVYGHVLKQAQELVTETRFDHSTNDICIIVIIQECRPEGHEVRFIGTTRQITHNTLQENFPELVCSIAALSKPVDPSGFLICIIDHDRTYVAEIACLDPSRGVLN
jgi:hypothetical protein